MRSYRCLLLVLLVLSATAAVERPSPQDFQQRTTVQLHAKSVAEGLLLRWSPANQAPSDGIKIAASTSHQQPVYGHGLDPALAWIAGTGHQEALISDHDLMRLSQGQPLALRLCFVREGAHDDPQAHLAYSNVIVVRPDAMPGERQAGKQVLRPRLPELGEWKPPAQHRGERAQNAPQREGLRQRIAETLQARGADADVPPPIELAREDLPPSERELLMRIHALEQRKHDLEAALAVLESQAE